MKSHGGAGTGAAVRAIEQAQRRTGKVRDDLAVASAELGLTQETLEQHLPPHRKQGDVRKALDQGHAVGRKLDQAAHELAEVHELLEDEALQRRYLEAELAKHRNGAA